MADRTTAAVESTATDATMETSIYIDWNNLILGNPRVDPHSWMPALVTSLMNDAESRVTQCCAYADWRRYTRYTSLLAMLDVKLVQMDARPHSGKTGAAVQMAVDVLQHILTGDDRAPQHIVLATGDIDITPLSRFLCSRENCARVTIVSWRESCSSTILRYDEPRTHDGPHSRVCDKVLFLEDCRVQEEDRPRTLYVVSGDELSITPLYDPARRIETWQDDVGSDAGHSYEGEEEEEEENCDGSTLPTTTTAFHTTMAATGAGAEEEEGEDNDETLSGGEEYVAEEETSSAVPEAPVAAASTPGALMRRAYMRCTFSKYLHALASRWHNTSYLGCLDGQDPNDVCLAMYAVLGTLVWAGKDGIQPFKLNTTFASIGQMFVSGKAEWGAPPDWKTFGLTEEQVTRLMAFISRVRALEHGDKALHALQNLVLHLVASRVSRGEDAHFKVRYRLSKYALRKGGRLVDIEARLQSKLRRIEKTSQIFGHLYQTFHGTNATLEVNVREWGE